MLGRKEEQAELPNAANSSKSEFVAQIVELYRSPEFLRLSDMYSRKNLFDILGIARKELVHSRVIKWLLDPLENHGLETFPLQQFLRAIAVAKDDQYPGNRSGKLDDRMRDAFVVGSYSILNATIELEKSIPSTSGKRKDRRIDLLATVSIRFRGESESKILPVILENKVDTDEHSDQTEDYHDWAANEYKNRGKFHPPVFVFLTPSSSRELEDASDNGARCPAFIHLNCQLLSELVLAPSLDRTPNDAAKTLLSDYLRCLSFAVIPTNEPNGGTNEQPNKGRTIMAIAPNEKQILLDFWEKHKTLLTAVIEALVDSPDLEEDERKAMKNLPGIINKSRQKFRFDGKVIVTKTAVVHAVVEKWIADHPGATFEQLRKAFPESGGCCRSDYRYYDRSKVGIVQPEEWFDGKKDGNAAFKSDAIVLKDGTKVFVWSIRWMDKEFNKFLEYTTKTFGYTIERIG